MEVLIAEQVAQKSDAFFQAMTSYDSLMYQLAKTLSVVKSLREQIAIIDRCLVKQSFHILKLHRRKCNCLLVLQKVNRSFCEILNFHLLRYSIVIQFFFSSS